MRFAKEGWPFVLPTAGLSAGLLLLGQVAWGWTAALAAVCLLLFFRIPTRRFEGDDRYVLAPANGKITKVDQRIDPDVDGRPCHRIVIFLSVLDVHVQRAPVEGVVVTSRYSAGRKIAAFRPQAGDVNEQQLTVLRRANGDLIGVRQIAGLLARRVVTYLETGSRAGRGSLIGLIKFGSRVDLLLPVSYHLTVREGQRLREGLTVVAHSETAR